MATRIAARAAWRITGAGLSLLILSGCESPDWTRSMNDSFASKKEFVSHDVEEQHRKDYVATHSRKSLRWLFGHCIESGMTYDDVCKVMGEDGTPDGRSNYVEDKMYSWKDDQGRAYYLGFREDRLVNFDRTDYR